MFDRYDHVVQLMKIVYFMSVIKVAYNRLTLYWGVSLVSSFSGTSVPITPSNIPLSVWKYTHMESYSVLMLRGCNIYYQRAATGGNICLPGHQWMWKLFPDCKYDLTGFTNSVHPNYWLMWTCCFVKRTPLYLRWHSLCQKLVVLRMSLGWVPVNIDNDIIVSDG